MSIQPALPNTGNVTERFAAALADVQRAVAEATAQIGYVPPGSISGGGTTGQIKASTITSAEIAAGTITAANIAAATITSVQIAANTITAGNIAANTITAGNIAAHTITSNELTSTAIDGMTITGSTFRTSSTANTTGAGVVMDTLGVRGYDATHTLKFNIDSTTGLIQATGVITAQPGSAVPTAVVTGFMPGSANRYSNSIFQDGQGAFDGTGWAANGITGFVTSTAVNIPYGTLVALLTCAGGDVTVTQAANTDSWRRVIPGFSYTSSNFVYPATTARNVRIDVAWYNSAGTLLSTSTGTSQTTTLNAWSRPTQTFTAPASAAYARPIHYVALSAAATETLYITGFQLEEGDRASAFAPRPDEVLINSITANNIVAGTITAAKLNITQLSAITANMGTITAGTITGSTFNVASGGILQTATSGDRAWIDSTGFNLAASVISVPTNIGALPHMDKVTWRRQSDNRILTEVGGITYTGGGAQEVDLISAAFQAAAGQRASVFLQTVDLSSTVQGQILVTSVDAVSGVTINAGAHTVNVLSSDGSSTYLQKSPTGAQYANWFSGTATMVSGTNNITATIAHGYGHAPAIVLANSSSNINTFVPVFARVSNIGATTFDINLFTVNLATATSNQSVAYQWLAIG